MHADIQKILFTAEQIASRVKELGHEIGADYNGRQMVLVGILKGAVPFFNDLLQALDQPVTHDFMELSSYGRTAFSSGAVQIVKDASIDITGKHVLLVEDIIDTGLTLHAAIEHLMPRKPASVKTCALLDKQTRRSIAITPDYSGFTIPDCFVVGYGLDYAEKYRNLPYIGVLKEEAYHGH